MLDNDNRTYSDKKKRYYRHLISKNKVHSRTHKYTIKEYQLYLFKQEIIKLLKMGITIDELK
jgi:hypothetical protein